jgi:hypothetical protein
MTSMPVARAAFSTEAIGFTGPRKLADVIAERFAEAARLHEIALHVDDEKRGRRPVERDRLRLRCELC